MEGKQDSATTQKEPSVIADKCLESETHTQSTHHRELAWGWQAAHNPPHSADARVPQHKQICAAAERNLFGPMPGFGERGGGTCPNTSSLAYCSTLSMSLAATCADCLQTTTACYLAPGPTTTRGLHTHTRDTHTPDDHVRDNPPRHAKPAPHREQVPAQTGHDRRQLPSGRCMHSDRHERNDCGPFQANR